MDENDSLLRLALSFYIEEPCRICGVLFTWNDIHAMVWSGYSKNNEAHCAHKVCWDKHLPEEEWKYQ